MIPTFTLNFGAAPSLRTLGLQAGFMSVILPLESNKKAFGSTKNMTHFATMAFCSFVAPSARTFRTFSSFSFGQQKPDEKPAPVQLDLSADQVDVLLALGFSFGGANLMEFATFQGEQKGMTILPDPNGLFIRSFVRADANSPWHHIRSHQEASFGEAKEEITWYLSDELYPVHPVAFVCDGPGKHVSRIYRDARGLFYTDLGPILYAMGSWSGPFATKEEAFTHGWTGANANV